MKNKPKVIKRTYHNKEKINLIVSSTVTAVGALVWIFILSDSPDAISSGGEGKFNRLSAGSLHAYSVIFGSLAAFIICFSIIKKIYDYLETRD
jgi:hypothetical protein